MTASVHQVQQASRRERKKQRTREALIEAAFQLFAEKGFEATTVEEIADAVDVSSRTFFRYFASKEDVALTFQEEQQAAVLAGLAARPADEPVVTALRHTVVEITRACERGELGFDTSRFQCMIDLTTNSPTMMARSLEHAQKKQAEMTRALAARMGVDPAQDMRPHVVASTLMGAFRAAMDIMDSDLLGYTLLSDAVDDAFGILEEGINYPSAGARAGRLRAPQPRDPELS